MPASMHAADVFDIIIAVACSSIGVYCFTRGFELWRGRNGGWTTRAICAVLAVKGVWAFSILLIMGYLWKTAIPVPTFTFWIYTGQNIANAACWAFLLATLLPKRKD